MSDGFPMSATTAGIAIGMFLPGIGIVLGAAIGAIIDVVRTALEAGKALKKMKKEFSKQLLNRWDNTVFITALERMAPAMEHLVSLGIKPGTPEFDELLIEKIGSEIGYKGNCAIDITGPAAEGKPRPLLAKIDREGNIQVFSQFFDISLGKQWQQACQSLHAEALKAWAEQRNEDVKFQKELAAEKETANKNAVTEMLVNGGVLLFILGYNVYLKKKQRKPLAQVTK